MTYDFTNLSHADFEDLARDLVGSEMKARFEAFAAGPDGGIDGRHAGSTGNVILQAKHYAGSRYSDLKRTMTKERASIDRLAPSRYVLATTCKLSPRNKAELAAIIGPTLMQQSDIYGSEDLNGLLRRYPDVAKSHIKLWLTGTAMLERVLNAAAHSFNDITREEIAAKLRVYAPNPSFDAAREILEKQHVVIISGPPGVGKTTLAEVLGYAHLSDDWELIAIRGLDDGLTAISDSRKQIFYFDDFLGRVALDKNALAKMDSDLARFITRVRKSPNARFMLTTRAPIFEEARRHSEHLADKQLDISRYLLDVGVYTRRIKARILYNHLLETGTPQTHIDALIDSGKLSSIVDHKNYSPRIIALMTDGARVSDVEPSAYPNAFIEALDNPTQLWEIPFRNHIPRTCQHLLMTLFFGDEFWVPIDRLRSEYAGYHSALSAHYGAPQDPKDFEESLRILEGGFVKIWGRSVMFVNPSVRDYLLSYMDDHTLLMLAAGASNRTEWAQAVWEHSKRLYKSSGTAAERSALALAFLPVAQTFLTQSVTIKVPEPHGGFVVRPNGISNVERLQLLLEWWDASRDDRYLALIEALSTKPVEGWDAWRDGEDLIVLAGKMRAGFFEDLPNEERLGDILEAGALDLVEDSSLNSEDLTKISDAYDNWSSTLGDHVGSAINRAVKREFDDIEEVLRSMDSEATVDEHLELLERLGKKAGIPEYVIEEAMAAAEERKERIESRSYSSRSPDVRNVNRQAMDTFDDSALNNLFAPLRNQPD